jgi:hypothetical protein
MKSWVLISIVASLSIVASCFCFYMAGAESAKEKMKEDIIFMSDTLYDKGFRVVTKEQWDGMVERITPERTGP